MGGYTRSRHSGRLRKLHKRESKHPPYSLGLKFRPDLFINEDCIKTRRAPAYFNYLYLCMYCRVCALTAADSATRGF